MKSGRADDRGFPALGDFLGAQKIGHGKVEQNWFEKLGQRERGGGRGEAGGQWSLLLVRSWREGRGDVARMRTGF